MTTKQTAFTRTISGGMFHGLDPRPHEVKIEDIAHSLSMKVRFTGHVKRFYSIAQHSLFVSKLLESWGYDLDLQLKGLLHDAAEAYLPDVPSPYKDLLVGFREIEYNVEQAIGAALDISFAHESAIKWADRIALFSEAATFVNGDIHTPRLDTEQPLYIHPESAMGPGEAVGPFLHRYWALRHGVEEQRKALLELF